MLSACSRGWDWSKAREIAMSSKSALLVAAVAAAVCLMPPQAHALLQLAGDVGATQFCATDQNVICGFGAQVTDLTPAVNTLAPGAIAIGGLNILGSVSTATFGAVNILDSSSLTITNTSAAPVTAHFTVSATGFL